MNLPQIGGLSSFQKDMKDFEQLGAFPMNIQLERWDAGLGICNTVINNEGKYTENATVHVMNRKW